MSQEPQQRQQGPDILEVMLARHAYEPVRARGDVEGEDVLLDAYVTPDTAEPTLQVVVGVDTYEGQIMRGTGTTMAFESVEQLDQNFHQLVERYNLELVEVSGRGGE